MGAKDKSPGVVSDTQKKAQFIFRAGAKVTKHCHMEKTFTEKILHGELRSMVVPFAVSASIWILEN